MTRSEIEQELDQWKVMVHGHKEFTPNCLCKFTWENEKKDDVWIFINNAQSIEDLIEIIKEWMFVYKVKASPEADLIINY